VARVAVVRSEGSSRRCLGSGQAARALLQRSSPSPTPATTAPRDSAEGRVDSKTDRTSRHRPRHADRERLGRSVNSVIVKRVRLQIPAFSGSLGRGRAWTHRELRRLGTDHDEVIA
jgi:hypothetical protein